MPPLHKIFIHFRFLMQSCSSFNLLQHFFRVDYFTFGSVFLVSVFFLFICIKCWLLALYSCGDASLHFRWFLHCFFFFFAFVIIFSLSIAFFSRTVVRSNCLFCAHSTRSNVKIHDRNRKRERIKIFLFAVSYFWVRSGLRVCV